MITQILTVKNQPTPDKQLPMTQETAVTNKQDKAKLLKTRSKQ